jgi:hypothetical protein
MGRAPLREEHSMHVDRIHRTHRRIGALAVVAALALVPTTALAAPPKPKPKPKPSPYIIYTMSEVQVS